MVSLSTFHLLIVVFTACIQDIILYRRIKVYICYKYLSISTRLVVVSIRLMNNLDMTVMCDDNDSVRREDNLLTQCL
jgi:hypothetical protein